MQLLSTGNRVLWLYGGALKRNVNCLHANNPRKDLGVGMFKRFFAHRRAAILPSCFAILLPVLPAAVGLALDLTNMMKAGRICRTRSTSGARRVASLSDMTGSRQDTFNAFFTTNTAGRPALKNLAQSLRSSRLSTASSRRQRPMPM